jgi:hypothetical protein
MAAGAPIPVHFRLTPLLDGLLIRAIHIELVETRTIIPDDGSPIQTVNQHTYTKVVVKEEREKHEIDEVSKSVPMEDSRNGYQFIQMIKIPRALIRYRQSIQSDQLIIAHQINVRIYLLNPDGHDSLVHSGMNIFLLPTADCKTGAGPTSGPCYISSECAYR